MNAQIGCIGSSLRIIDYSVGLTGSAHDAIAFEQTAAFKYPELVFKDDEFAWTDSAYSASYRVIPVHKAPANLDPKVQLFDYGVSRLRIRSEHCNGAIKARWQSLKGLRIAINCKRDHLRAMEWISACFVLHNITVEVEGSNWVDYYAQGEMQRVECGVIETENIGSEESGTGGLRQSQLQVVEDYFQYSQK
ncbi:hypothetical protein RSAG8_07054, partial [Rhizoctonia solani AG-8 WAC10335]